jgi:hypothetical protein
MTSSGSGSKLSTIRRREDSIRREYRLELRRLEAVAVNWPQVQLKRPRTHGAESAAGNLPEGARAELRRGDPGVGTALPGSAGGNAAWRRAPPPK